MELVWQLLKQGCSLVKQAPCTDDDVGLGIVIMIVIIVIVVGWGEFQRARRGW